MTLVYLWGRYQKDCKPYQYRKFCELYARWCEEYYETLHIQAVIGQKTEDDFAGKTFDLIFLLPCSRNMQKTALYESKERFPYSCSLNYYNVKITGQDLRKLLRIICR